MVDFVKGESSMEERLKVKDYFLVQLYAKNSYHLYWKEVLTKNFTVAEFLGANFALPFTQSTWSTGTNKLKLFVAFAVFTPMVVGASVPAVLGGFFAHDLWKQNIGHLVTDEIALKAISVSSIVLASILGAAILTLLIENLIALAMKPPKDDPKGLEI